ncbi:hypothetical protein SynRS9909_02064 [Synechococcus sp. RS9909]|nr:hypothetical protein SynRS9909_02064 [Synechococcus sp. RS9909]
MGSVLKATSSLTHQGQPGASGSGKQATDQCLQHGGGGIRLLPAIDRAAGDRVTLAIAIR